MTQILTSNFKGEKFDLLYAIEEEHRKRLEAIVAKHAKVTYPYYIIVISHNQPNGKLRIHYQIEPKEPAIAMLGTVVYKVDNSSGEITRLYILPKDVPMPEGVLSDVQDNSRLGGDNIADDAKRLGMPIWLS